MHFIIALLGLFLIYFFIEKGWHLDQGWAMRATIITIVIGAAGLILLIIYYSRQH